MNLVLNHLDGKLHLAITSFRERRPRWTYLPLGVAEDDGLGDGQGVVEVTEGVELPLLSLHSNEELLDALQSQLITGDQKKEPEGLDLDLEQLRNQQ